jgi:hypothetical protein
MLRRGLGTPRCWRYRPRPTAYQYRAALGLPVARGADDTYAVRLVQAGGQYRAFVSEHTEAGA